MLHELLRRCGKADRQELQLLGLKHADCRLVLTENPEATGRASLWTHT